MKQELIITPHHKLWSVDFRELWRYRDLIELFVKRNIVVQYKQTILGPLWYLIQPVLTVIMNMIVFGGIAKMSTDGIPQPLFYMAGNVCWFYFADCLNQTSSTFTTNQQMFSKVYFPRLVDVRNDHRVSSEYGHRPDASPMHHGESSDNDSRGTSPRSKAQQRASA